MFSNGKAPPKPVIRKVTVQRPADPPKTKAHTNGHANGKAVNGKSANGKSLNGAASKKNGGGSSGASRLHLTSSRSASNGLLKPRTDSKTASPARGNKRKQPSHSPTPNFGSSSSEDEDDDFSDGARKRARPSPGMILDEDMKRVIFDDEAFREVDGKELENGKGIIEGYDITVGGEIGKEYKVIFESEGKEVPEVELQYPSGGKERFQLLIPHDAEGFNPIEDIIQTVSHICTYLFPPSSSTIHTDEATGFERRLKRAVNERSLAKFTSIVTEFNSLIAKSTRNDDIPSFLQAQHSLPLPLIERILSQVYARTVSPHVHLLKQYENGTDDVYGELLPRFSHQIFQDTHLTSDQVFVDLGSGVGNVVLQAALQIGCESWGIERMPNPASLAQKQQLEFEPRCRKWGIKPGKINLITGDFLLTPEIDAVLRRADVILINNQAFTPELNTDLTMKFLDLKEGCKIVSLRSFVPDNWTMKERNLQDPRNLLGVEKKTYWSGSVSWTDVGGSYFVARKDSRKLRRFVEKTGGR